MSRIKCPSHPLGGYIVRPNFIKCSECNCILWRLEPTSSPGVVDIIPAPMEGIIGRTREEFQKELEGLVGKKELAEFRKFAFKDRMMEMAIAFMLGASFKAVVSSIVNNLLMPLIDYASDFTGNSWREMKWEPVEGLVFEIGTFSGAFLDFLLMAIILYILYVKIIKKVVGSSESSKS